MSAKTARSEEESGFNHCGLCALITFSDSETSIFFINVLLVFTLQVEPGLVSLNNFRDKEGEGCGKA